MNNSFDINLYKNQLSSFGQKVLRVLVEQWHEEKDNYNNQLRQRHYYIQKNKDNRDLNKHDSFDQFDPNVGQYSKKKCTLKFAEKQTPIASTPYDMIDKCKFTSNTQKEMILCRDDLVNSAIEFNTNADSCSRINDERESSKGEMDLESIQIIDLESPGLSQNNVNDVSWNNMFDTELFRDNNKDENIQNKFITLENTLDETPVHTFKKPEIKHAKRINTTKVTEPKQKKQKSLTVSSMVTVPRKEKYTKSVKNWLDDVEKNTDVIINLENIETALIKDKSGIATDCKIISPKEKTKKKIVQAQLANKEGKMKFGKPKNVTDNKIKENKIHIEAKPDKETGKEKKIKSKFVAPIKSQIPVKDLSYNIITMDAENAKKHADNLRLIANSEIFVVLIYRNGSSQLNSNYFEDPCIPEGILMNLDEDFYYFKTIDQISVRTLVADVLQAHTIICYEGKHILIFLSHYGVKINPTTICDTKVGGALLDPDNPPESFSDLQKLMSYTAEYTIATECSLQKAAWYTTLLRETTSRLRHQLIENSLWNVFVDVEMRLLPIIADMEHRGVSVDLEKLKSMEHILVSKLKTVEKECHNAAGRPFQVNSPLQVRALLYDELKLDAKCNVKIRETLAQGAKSTSETTLRSLMSVHPLPKLILEYRHLHKAHATFLTGIAQHVKDGIVKPTWVQTAATTGRIASSNPNLQAIPKAPFSLNMFPEPKDTGATSELNFRSVYTARAGHWLLAADFQHVECRVFAHAAADTALLDALRSEHDLFRVLAAKWMNKPEQEVSDADRERTKRIVYASLYGAGARKLMDILGVSYDQTLAIVASFNRTFPSLKSFGRSVVSQCERSGGRLSTLCGRARTFKNISSQDFAARSQAERQAVNFIVQGSAADLCKTAMVLTAERLRARLVLQIHDELVWEVRDDDLLTAAAVVKEVMEGCGQRCGLPLRLPVRVAAGRDWGHMSPIDTMQQD